MAIHYRNIHNCAQLIELVDEIGFLPLLRVGVSGWSAEEQVAPECNYTPLPDGGWDWPLWQWKGEVIQASGCAYGKLLLGKAAFVSKAQWPHFCHWRRSKYPIADGSVEAMILSVLREQGSMTTRDLRVACGFVGPKMRGRFDTFLTRLERSCHVVAGDFVYSHDRHGRPYGWGQSLLATPESLFGRAACHPACSPQESYSIIERQMSRLFPDAGPEGVAMMLR